MDYSLNAQKYLNSRFHCNLCRASADCQNKGGQTQSHGEMTIPNVKFSFSFKYLFFVTSHVNFRHI